MRTRLLVCALALLLPATALADPKDDARRHFVAGLEAAKEGEYEVALQRFLAAQEAYPHPATLYNIAKSYTDLQDYPNALTYYRLYQDAAPEKAGEVADVVAVLESRLQGPRVPAAVPATVPGEEGGAVVRVGPTDAELARLQALAAELDALTRAFQDRAATPVPQGTEAQAPPGQTPEDQVPEVPELGEELISDAYQRVVVTASRYGQEPLDSPSTVTIITAEDIRLSGATSIPDLLRRVTGVDVMSGTSSKPDVSIRGFNDKLSNKVLVLIDGRSVYIDFLGTTLWNFQPVVLEEIERIEVIRGPGSAVYGANAVTGVINIITRAPGEGSSLVKVEGGSTGYRNATAVATGRAGGTAYRFSGAIKELGRWSKDADLQQTTALSSSLDDQDTALSTIQVAGRMDRTFGEEGYASVSAGYLQGVMEFYSIGVLGDYFFDARKHYVRGDVAWGPVHLRGFWNSEVGQAGPWLQYQDTPRDLVTHVDTDVVDVELEGQGELETGPVTHRLNLGASYRYKGVDFGYLRGDEPIVEHHLAAFVSEEASVERIKVVGTFRVDRHPLIDISETLSPRGSIIYRVADSTSIRATGGSSFRAPNFIESYLELDLDSGTDGVFIRDFGMDGVRDIHPERILTGEVGVHDESTLYHTADAALYVNRVTDLIGLTPVVGVGDYYDPEANGFRGGDSGFANSPAVYTAWGAEVEAEVFPLDGLDVWGNVAVERIQVEEEGETYTDESTSLLKVNGGVMYRSPWRTDLSLGAHYASGQTWLLREFDASGDIVANPAQIDSRLILTARLAARPLKEHDLELAVSGWNLLGLAEDQRFLEHPAAQPVGAIVYGSLSYAF